MKEQKEKHFGHGDLSRIAVRSGYSVSTVRQYYSGRLKLTPDTEEKILEAFSDVMQDKVHYLKSVEAKAVELADMVADFRERLSSELAELS